MDPLTFPVLAGDVLKEAVKFLFDRAAAVLDRRAGRASAHEPERVAGQAEPLQARLTELTDARIERIMQAQGALSVYLARPELLRGDDEALRELLGRLRTDLGAVYGRNFPFGDEQHARPGVEVSQHADYIANKQVGVRSRGVSETARVQVIQTAKTIGATGEQVGVEIEGSIG